MKSCFQFIGLILLSAICASCQKETPAMLGTLEWERITLPATASEPIVEIKVQEGAMLEKSQILLQLDASHAKARIATLQFEAAQAEQSL